MAPSALGHPRLPSLQGPFPSGSLPYCSCFPNDVWWGVITLVSYLQSLSGCQKKKKGGRGEEKEPEFYSWWPSPLSPLNSARVAKSCAAPRVSWSRGIHKTSGGRMNIYCKSPSGLRAPDECLLGPGATRRGFQQAPPWVPSLASPLMSPGKLTS